MAFFTGQKGKFFKVKIKYFEQYLNSILKPSHDTAKKASIDLTPGCCGEDTSREKCCGDSN